MPKKPSLRNVLIAQSGLYRQSKRKSTLFNIRFFWRVCEWEHVSVYEWEHVCVCLCVCVFVCVCVCERWELRALLSELRALTKADKHIHFKNTTTQTHRHRHTHTITCLCGAKVFSLSLSLSVCVMWFSRTYSMTISKTAKLYIYNTWNTDLPYLRLQAVIIRLSTFVTWLKLLTHQKIFQLKSFKFLVSNKVPSLTPPSICTGTICTHSWQPNPSTDTDLRWDSLTGWGDWQHCTRTTLPIVR